jgi:hypothetical protein
MTYGIQMDRLPTTDNGNFPLDNHHNWIAQRQRLESMEETGDEQEELIVPGPHDVVMGRQWEAQSHVGNIGFRGIINKHGDAYDQAKKQEKTAISQAVVREIKASGSRFLKLEGTDHYVLVGDKSARVKVGSAFRDRRKALINEEARRDKRRSLEQVALEPCNKGYDFVEMKRPKCI